MARKAQANQIPFRYKDNDSPAGVTRGTTQAIARFLGVDETNAIHRALREYATRHLPQYERDDGPLTAADLRAIRRRVGNTARGRVVSSLFD